MTDTKEIPLTKGVVAIVDAADYALLMGYKWFVSDKGYALCRRVGRSSGEAMHRMLLRPPKGMVPDHINGNRLDNRRCNLRLVTALQNAQNRGINKITTSKYKGVCWKVENNKWQARIRVNGKQHHIGLYETEIEAAKAYNAAALLNHGDYSRLNVIPPDEDSECYAGDASDRKAVAGDKPLVSSPAPAPLSPETREKVVADMEYAAKRLGFAGQGMEAALAAIAPYVEKWRAGE